MLDKYKEKFRLIEKFMGKIFSKIPLSPNQYTFSAILFAVFSFYFLINKSLILATTFFIFASFLDFIDGAVARYKGVSTKIGAYLDTICDRYVEAILIFGLMFLPFPKIFLPHYIWLSLILFGSTLTTYAKAAAKEKELVNQELKGGFLSRTERLILLIICLGLIVIDKMRFSLYLLILLAILTNFTAVQRIFSAISLNSSSLLRPGAPKKE